MQQQQQQWRLFFFLSLFCQIFVRRRSLLLENGGKVNPLWEFAEDRDGKAKNEFMTRTNLQIVNEQLLGATGRYIWS